MKRFRTWLIRIGIAIVILVVVLASAGTWFVRRSWPQVSGTVQASGLSAPVQVLRDRWGVPQIYAQNDHDLFFAQGYVHAQDRLWQMEINRHVSSGTLSEILGQRSVDTDVFLRTLGLRRVAERSWAGLDSDSRAILDAYAEGVNRYVDTHRDRLPVEFSILGVSPEPWTPIDSLAWGNLLAYRETVQGWEEIEYARLIDAVGAATAQQLIPTRDRNTPLILPSSGVAKSAPAATGSRAPLRSTSFERGSAGLNEWLGDPGVSWGSNSWVIQGSRTATGKPILANDTHIDLRMPSFWYENGLHGGRFDSVGFTFPGVPLVLLGHNQRVAWGVTNLRADDQDNYIEKLNDPDKPTQYEFEGQWQHLESIHETINVKGRDPMPLEVHVTRHGPIVNLDGGTDKALSIEKSLALRWTLYDGNQTFKSIVLLNLAANWDEFRAALQHWEVPAQSFIYADMAGNIGYQAAGRIPIRAPGDDGRLPVPGSTEANEWQGFIPFDKLPTVFNPPAGFIVTANNKVTSDDYPYLITSMWNPGYRAERITDLLSTSNPLTIKDIQQIEADTYSLPAKALLPYLLAIKPANDIQARAIDYLKAWDLTHETNSVGASIYEAWYLFMIKNTAEKLKLYDPPPTEVHLCARPTWLIELLGSTNNSVFPDRETRDDITSRSLGDALDWLSNRYGKNPDDWQWGRLHTMTFIHTPLGQSGIAPLVRLFNSGPIAVRGDSQAVDMGEYDCYNRPFEEYFGTSQRMIIDLAGWDSMLSVNSTGQSEHLFHPNRTDQIPLWQQGEYHPMPFSRKAVEETAQATLTLTP